MSRLTPLHLIAFILFLLLLVLASNVKAAPESTGHISTNVCKPCSITFCNFCPLTLQQQSVMTPVQQTQAAMDALIQQNKDRRCNALEAAGDDLPDWCFNMQTVMGE